MKGRLRSPVMKGFYLRGNADIGEYMMILLDQPLRKVTWFTTHTTALMIDMPQ
jgi:hypothetical protein